MVQHRIDLLKGQGIPARTTFAGMVIIAVTVIVPIIVSAAMLDSYLQNWMKIDWMSGEITKYQGETTASQEQVKQYNSSLSRRTSLTSKLSEVSRCVKTFVQWSPILVTVAQDMPGQMVMDGLSTQSKASKPPAQSEDEKDKNKPVEIPIPERSIMLEAQGRGEGNYDTVAREYFDSLKSSEVIKGKLNSFDFIRQPGRTGDEQSVSYKLNFILKTGSK
jgi:hypothetical protein